MAEDDTFNALKKIPYKDVHTLYVDIIVREFFSSFEKVDSIIESEFKKVGWTVDEYYKYTDI